MPSIRVKGLDTSIEVDAGADLRRACMDNNVNLFFGPWAKVLNCRGKGFCNLCKVEVVDGSDRLTPRTKREQKRLKDKPDTWRLACCTKVQGDIEIDSFPVRHAADILPPEALQRSGMEGDELKELEREDWAALQEDKSVKKKGPKKGLLAKVRKKKGIDDSDDRAPGEALEEDEAAPGEEGTGKRGLFGKGRKKNGEADGDENGSAEGSVKGKRAKKDKKDKKAKKGKKGETKDETDDADPGEPAAATDPSAPANANGDKEKADAEKGKKRFGLKARKK